MDQKKVDTNEDENPDETVFRKTNDIPPIYQDFVKTIPIEEIEASKKPDFRKTNDIPPIYQDFVKTIPPNEKYTWTEMNEMVEREIRSVVGKMTDAIKEEIVGHWSEEHQNNRLLNDSSYERSNGKPLTLEKYEQLWFSVISVFNVYLIKVLHKIVDDYKYIGDYKKYSTVIRDILDIALKNEDAFAAENFPKGGSNSGTQHNLIPGDYMYAFMNVSLNKIQEYKDLMDPDNLDRWVDNHIFIGNVFKTFLSLLGMMIERHIFPYNKDFESKELIVHSTHWGVLAPGGIHPFVLVKNSLINVNSNKINKPFLMRFFTIFRDFYSFLIDEIDYDLPVKKGGKSRKRRIRRNKKTRNHKK
jgi:hypothetical protein